MAMVRYWRLRYVAGRLGQQPANEQHAVDHGHRAADHGHQHRVFRYE
jgi:hypothetical protein